MHAFTISEFHLLPVSQSFAVLIIVANGVVVSIMKGTAAYLIFII